MKQNIMKLIFTLFALTGLAGVAPAQFQIFTHQTQGDITVDYYAAKAFAPNYVVIVYARSSSPTTTAFKVAVNYTLDGVAKERDFLVERVVSLDPQENLYQFMKFGPGGIHTLVANFQEAGVIAITSVTVSELGTTSVQKFVK